MSQFNPDDDVIFRYSGLSQTYIDDILSRLIEASDSKIHLEPSETIAADGTRLYSKRLCPYPNIRLQTSRNRASRFTLRDTITVTHWAVDDPTRDPKAPMLMQFGYMGSGDQNSSFSKAIRESFYSGVGHEAFQDSLTFPSSSGDYAPGLMTSPKQCPYIWKKELPDLYIMAKRTDDGGSFALSVSIKVQAELIVSKSEPQLRMMGYTRESRRVIQTNRRLLPKLSDNSITRPQSSSSSSYSKPKKLISRDSSSRNTS